MKKMFRWTTGCIPWAILLLLAGIAIVSYLFLAWVFDLIGNPRVPSIVDRAAGVAVSVLVAVWLAMYAGVEWWMYPPPPAIKS